MLKEAMVPNANADDMAETLRYLGKEYVSAVELIPNFNKTIVRARLSNETPCEISERIDKVIGAIAMISAGFIGVSDDGKILH